MLIDLKLDGKTVLIVGGGKVGERKARKILEENVNVKVASAAFTKGLRKLSKEGKIRLFKIDIQKELHKIGEIVSRFDVVFAAVSDPGLNEAIVKGAKRVGALVCAVDNPSISDFSVPAVMKVGDISVAVSTQGKSPAMAKILSRKLATMVTKEEALQVRLQHHVRSFLKDEIPEQTSRRDVLYQIIQDGNIRRLLRDGKLNEAKKLAERMVRGLR